MFRVGKLAPHFQSEEESMKRGTGAGLIGAFLFIFSLKLHLGLSQASLLSQKHWPVLLELTLVLSVSLSLPSGITQSRGASPRA